MEITYNEKEDTVYVRFGKEKGQWAGIMHDATLYVDKTDKLVGVELHYASEIVPKKTLQKLVEKQRI